MKWSAPPPYVIRSLMPKKPMAGTIYRVIWLKYATQKLSSRCIYIYIYMKCLETGPGGSHIAGRRRLLIHSCFSMDLKLFLQRSISTLVWYLIPSSVFKAKAWKGIEIIRFLSKYVSRDVLDQIYKLYARLHFYYGDIIYHRYDPKFKLESTKRLESTQYSAALAVSGAWRGTDTDNLYEELGREILNYRRWYRRLCHFHKLRNAIELCTYTLRYHRNVLFIIMRRANVYEANAKSTDRFSHTYFQNCTREWNQLDHLLKVHLQSLCSKGNLCA